MCLIAFAWGLHPDYPLIVAGNRDEFYKRPSAAADWWPESPNVLAGRDLQAGGTWMGVARNGRFAVLTNYRSPPERKTVAPSRGMLCADYLAGSMPAGEYIDSVMARADDYNGFNLLLAERPHDPSCGTLHFIGNRPGQTPRILPPGLHGLSNAELDTPWPKVLKLKEAMQHLVDKRAGPETLCSGLFAALDDPQRAPDDRLPATGVSLDWERALSSAMIRLPDYGTRSTTILLIHRDASVHYVERRFPPDCPAGAPFEERSTHFAIDP